MDAKDNRKSRPDSFRIDQIDYTAAGRIVRALDTLDAAEAPSIGGEPTKPAGATRRKAVARRRPRRTLRRRMRLLRAAFVGEVRMSMLIVLVVAMTWAIGWGSAVYLQKIKQEQTKQLLRSQAENEAWHQLGLDLSRVREDADENAYFIRALDAITRELEKVRQERQHASDQDQ